VVRPAGAEVVASDGPTPQADPWLPGRFWFEEGGFTIELRPKRWPASASKVEEPRGMTTVRAALPSSSLAVTVKGDKEGKPQLMELPKKTKLALIKGRATLEPGRHELLVQADGYLPKRLSLNLKPGERKELAVELDPIPGLPAGFPGSLGAGALPSTPPHGPPASLPQGPPAGASAGFRPPAYTPPPAYVPRYQPPRYQPPAYQPSAPVPRFTPIPAAPQPIEPAPVPMFTPIP
jgi:hypothetical protein